MGACVLTGTRLLLMCKLPNNGLLSCKGTSPTTNHPSYIVAKKWDTGILDPGPFSAKIRKVEARLGKLAKIRGSLFECQLVLNS